MREHVFRLVNGDNLKESIQQYCIDNSISSAIVLTCVGSLRYVRIRLANAQNFYTAENHYEIVSLVGTISQGQAHIHISISDENGNVIGGHLSDGCVVYTTAEIALGELEDYELKREMDETTGYKELVVSKK